MQEEQKGLVPQNLPQESQQIVYMRPHQEFSGELSVSQIFLPLLHYKLQLLLVVGLGVLVFVLATVFWGKTLYQNNFTIKYADWSYLEDLRLPTEEASKDEPSNATSLKYQAQYRPDEDFFKDSEVLFSQSISRKYWDIPATDSADQLRGILKQFVLFKEFDDYKTEYVVFVTTDSPKATMDAMADFEKYFQERNRERQTGLLQSMTKEQEAELDLLSSFVQNTAERVALLEFIQAEPIAGKEAYSLSLQKGEKLALELRKIAKELKEVEPKLRQARAQRMLNLSLLRHDQILRNKNWFNNAQGETIPPEKLQEINQSLSQSSQEVMRLNLSLDAMLFKISQISLELESLIIIPLTTKQVSQAQWGAFLNSPSSLRVGKSLAEELNILKKKLIKLHALAVNNNFLILLHQSPYIQAIQITSWPKISKMGRIFKFSRAKPVVAKKEVEAPTLSLDDVKPAKVSNILIVLAILGAFILACVTIYLRILVMNLKKKALSSQGNHDFLTALHHWKL